MLDITLSVVAAVALANIGSVKAQNGSGSVSDPVAGTPSSALPTTAVEPPATPTTTTTTTTSTTSTTTISTTEAPTATSTTTAVVVPPTTVSTHPTSASVYVPPPSSQLPPPTGPVRSSGILTSYLPTSSATVGPSTGGSDGTSSTTSSNVPAIVGSIAGVAALIIIVATSVICYRRRRRNNRELTFDTLQGMSGPGAASGKRQSFNFLTHGDSPTVSGRAAVGLNSVTSGGYDDGYDYEMQSNSGYPVQHHNYNTNSFDGYVGGPTHPGYHPSPTIFQEDLIQHQATAAASSLPVAAAFATAGRSRTGFDQNLPEVMYNNGIEDHAAATGYYNDADIYNQPQSWNGQQADGYVGPQGLWVANPEALRRQEEEAEYYNHINTIYGGETPSDGGLLTSEPVHPGQFASAHSLESTTLVSNGGEVSPTRNKFRSSGNPQTVPEDSPILKSSTLRGGGEVFAQESAARPTSPRVPAQETVATSSSSSPRLGNTRELRSFEISRQAPSRSSGEHVQSYAADYVRERPSVDVGRSTLPNGVASPVSPLNPNKSLRTLRHEDWS